jgi:hypothetical protein
MKLTLENDPRVWRRFTLTALPAPAVLGGVLLWKGVLPTSGLLVWLGVLGVLAVLCLARPVWFRGFYRVGMTVGFIVSRVLGWITLSLIFCLVVTPLGAVLRWLGHDPLQLRRDPQARSYWHTPRARHDLDRMF